MAMHVKTVLALNSGSSSLKYGLFRLDAGAVTELASGSSTRFDDAGDAPMDQGAAVAGIAASLARDALPAPQVVAHRVVHGGIGLRLHACIDAAVLRAIESACVFAPSHTPATLQVIAAARAAYAGVPQVACLDTCFHAAMPAAARTLPIAARWRTEGVHRHGFHGLACESIVAQLGLPPPSRLIIAHLGSGASVTAVRDGHSVDTSMGLTPTGGVLMGARTGDVDPGMLLYLMRAHDLDADALEELVTHSAGMHGISGTSPDMRVLRPLAGRDAHAALALRMFALSVARAIAGMITVLDGVDALVFSGGIGSNDPLAREEICSSLGWIGVRVDAARNRAGDAGIHGPDSRCRILVCTANEEAQMARHAAALLQLQALPVHGNHDRE
jgi:acetate kinase